ncbi:MAG: glucuronyl hydrolase, partial [Lentisphaerae bacterium]
MPLNQISGPIPVRDIVHRVIRRGFQVMNLEHYTGILFLHGCCRYAVECDHELLTKDLMERLSPFVREVKAFPCNFLNYRCGGNATAWLLLKGKLPEAAPIVERYAEELLHAAPRTQEGIFTLPRDPDKGKVWIDVAFAVSPFLAFAGLALNRPDYLDEAVFQTKAMVELLRDPQTGLLHQSRGFNGLDKFSQDHWSRGNGWGLFALAELLQVVPDDHPQRLWVEATTRDLLLAALSVQDDDGMWHQEMTMPESYPETSGTGLILYALGVA